MTSTSMSFVNNDAPFFLTIRKGPLPALDADQENRLVLQYYIDLKILRATFTNCSKFADSIGIALCQKMRVEHRLLGKIDFVLNEIIENFYKYSAGTENLVLIKIYAIPHKNSEYQSFIIKSSNLSNREDVKGIIESFRLIRKEHTEKEHFAYRKDFLQKRGHMGWIAITKLNTMVHITAHKESENLYNIDTHILLTG